MNHIFIGRFKWFYSNNLCNDLTNLPEYSNSDPWFAGTNKCCSCSSFIMEIVKSIAHPDEVLALLKFKLGGGQHIIPKQKLVRIYMLYFSALLWQKEASVNLNDWIIDVYCSLPCVLFFHAKFYASTLILLRDNMLGKTSWYSIDISGNLLQEMSLLSLASFCYLKGRHLQLRTRRAFIILHIKMLCWEPEGC